MSDTPLALLITVILLLALAAWVPILHTAETLITRLTEREATPSKREKTLDTREAA